MTLFSVFPRSDERYQQPTPFRAGEIGAKCCSTQRRGLLGSLVRAERRLHLPNCISLRSIKLHDCPVTINVERSPLIGKRSSRRALRQKKLSWPIPNPKTANPKRGSQISPILMSDDASILAFSKCELASVLRLFRNPGAGFRRRGKPRDEQLASCVRTAVASRTCSSGGQQQS